MYKCGNCNKIFRDNESESIKWCEIPGQSSPFDEDACPYCGAGRHLWEDLGMDDISGEDSGEDRAIAAMERAIADCETNYGDRDY